ncbi:hypothetical protein N7504_005342 [Penicillium tannophilum]|nr:hypothetical protein N7504_005342 [Penicillium tannophilum]
MASTSKENISQEDKRGLAFSLEDRLEIYENYLRKDKDSVKKYHKGDKTPEEEENYVGGLL